MERGHNLKLIGGPVVLTVLICTGIFLYMQADYQRFVEELGERTEVAPTPISPQEKPTTQPPEATETSATLAAQAAVIRRGRALSGITGRKGRAGGEVSQT